MDPLFPVIGSFVIRRLERVSDKQADAAMGYVAALLKARFGKVSEPHRTEVLPILRQVHGFDPKRHPILDEYLKGRLKAFQQDIFGLNASEPYSTCGFYELYEYFLHPVLQGLQSQDRILKVHAGNVIRDYLSPRFSAYIGSHRSPGSVKQLFVFDDRDLQASDEQIAQVISELHNEDVEVRFTSWPQIRMVQPALHIQDVNIALYTKAVADEASTICVRYVDGRPGFPRGRISSTAQDITHAKWIWQRFFELEISPRVWKSKTSDLLRDIREMKQVAKEVVPY